MYHININARESIGEIRLGMTRDEVEAVTQTMPSSIYHNFSYNRVKLEEVELANGRNIKAVLVDYNIELFRTPVEELIPRLSEITPYRENPMYIEGTMFDFPKLGLKLWREDNITSKDLEDEKFTSLDEDEFEYYREKLYFETVLIYSGID